MFDLNHDFCCLISINQPGPVAEKSQQCRKYFLQYSKFEHGGAKLASCPGRHRTQVRPWVDDSRKSAKSGVRGREPMAREPDVALLMTASGSLGIFLTWFLRMKLL